MSSIPPETTRPAAPPAARSQMSGRTASLVALLITTVLVTGLVLACNALVFMR